MSHPLMGKVALVTGAARGIGEATAVALAERGARVIVTDINVELGKVVAERIGSSAIFVEHDVSDEASWEETIGAALRVFNKINVVVNNAGFVRVGTIEDETAEGLRSVTSVMLDGVFYGMKHGIRSIKLSEEPGSIVNVSSTAAISGQSAFIAYTAAKGAVRSMTRSAAAYCQEQQYSIRVNAVLPGGIATPLMEDYEASIKDFMDRTGRAPTLAMPRGPGTEQLWPDGQPEDAKVGPGLGHPKDVASVMAFLASDDAMFVNGAEIVVDNCASILAR
jgi:3(or 17)beta-hydroxysteroid dehydrogenase